MFSAFSSVFNTSYFLLCFPVPGQCSQIWINGTKGMKTMKMISMSMRRFTRFHAVSRTWNMHWISMDFREAPYCCHCPENLPRLSGFRSALALRSRWGQLGLFDLVLHADQSLHHSIIVSLYQSLSMSLGLLLLQLQDDILDHAPSFTKARKQTEIYV